MATPAFLRVSPILRLGSMSVGCLGSDSMLRRHCTITNMSSMPMPAWITKLVFRAGLKVG